MNYAQPQTASAAIAESCISAVGQQGQDALCYGPRKSGAKSSQKIISSTACFQDENYSRRLDSSAGYTLAGLRPSSKDALSTTEELSGADNLEVPCLRSVAGNLLSSNGS